MYYFHPGKYFEYHVQDLGHNCDGSSVDIVPTILEMAGVSEQQRQILYPQLKGEDLSSLLAAPDAAISSIEATLASPAKPHPESALDVWIDLGPHLLAAIQALLPGSQPDWATLKCKTDVAECCCTVEMFSGRQRVPCTLHVHRSQGRPAHIRRIAINGITVDVEDYHTDAGIFAAHLVSQTGQTADHDDALRILIRRLIAGHPSMPAAVAIDNQRLLLRIARELC